MPKFLTQTRLKELLHYDPKAGHFTCVALARPSGGGRRVGSRVGCINKITGYELVSVDGAQHYAHRLAFLYMDGFVPIEVDHANGIKSDNRWQNLRAATVGLNRANRRSYRRSDLPKGVYLTPEGRFLASITNQKRTKYLGTFDAAGDAHSAYCVAARAAFGEFANTGEC